MGHRCGTTSVAPPVAGLSHGRLIGGRNLPAIEGYPLLLEGGDTAFPGVGSGPVVAMDEEWRPGAFPEGAVLVAPRSSPRFVRLMSKQPPL